jgi:hypothetical protein
MTKDEVLKLALKTLEYAGPSWIDARQPAITAIKEALANEALEKMAENARELGLDYEPEQDWIERERAVGYREGHRAALAQRTWIGLTEDEILLISAECAASHQHTDTHFARAIEAKLKEKNT